MSTAIEAALALLARIEEHLRKGKAFTVSVNAKVESQQEGEAPGAGGSPKPASVGSTPTSPAKPAAASPVDEARCECGHAQWRHCNGGTLSCVDCWHEEHPNDRCDKFRPAKPTSEKKLISCECACPAPNMRCQGCGFEVDTRQERRDLLSRIRERVKGIDTPKLVAGPNEPEPFAREVVVRVDDVLAILADFEREVKP
jgi:hypothetical protein